MKRIILLLITLFSLSAEAVELKIMTANGYVGFAPEDHWTVLNMQSKLPVATAVFQIPNPADNNTPDSTNLIISLYDQNTEKGKNALAKVGKPYSLKLPTRSKHQDWELYTQNAVQGNTKYTIIDAVKPVADVMVSVRIAWPNLPNNPNNYAKTTNQLYLSFLNSVSGAIGAYEPKEDEIIRRPNK